MQAIFGGTIAVVLLGIYVRLIWVACLFVDCVNKIEGCQTASVINFNEVMSQALNVIHGLVSALVIAELAITKPGETPALRVLDKNASKFYKSIFNIVTITYVFVWLIAGFFAFMKGMYHPETLPALTNVGQSWLGLAVASAYAYFGIKTQTPS